MDSGSIWAACAVIVVALGVATAVIIAVLGRRDAATRTALTAGIEAGREAGAAALRGELNERLTQQSQQLTQLTGETARQQEQKLENIRRTLDAKLDAVRVTTETSIKALTDDNRVQLDRMRETVDEKLQKTLEDRISKSFAQVSTQLKEVYEGLGKMQSLASDVGNLQRVLSSVKTRGNLGEHQLEAILEQILSPEQYIQNAQVRANSQERVEFAIKLPGRAADDEGLLLPIDSKFPIEDYERLLDAHDGQGDESVEVIQRRLVQSLKKFAGDIKNKYINPPTTTDFAILFVPTEGLYAEILRVPGLFDDLQRDCHVTVVGPTNLVAFLSSLRLGFRTLAIERSSTEVWKVLENVRKEFDKFAEALDKARRNLQLADKNLEDLSGVRTRQIQRQLDKVGSIDTGDVADAVGLPSAPDNA
ncbi:MAG: DNA recombination protein RmuC [Actinomycetes bacterium]|nr:DNA recombination protein RmuC [Actinomycetes bacterium]